MRSLQVYSKQPLLFLFWLCRVMWMLQFHYLDKCDIVPHDETLNEMIWAATRESFSFPVPGYAIGKN